MVDVWVVVGPPNSRKSSTIRALTGVGRIGPVQLRAWQMAYAPGNPGHRPGNQGVATFVHPRSLQEASPGMPAVAPNAFIQAVKNSGSNFVIVALRRNGANGQPDAGGYLQDFQRAGWTIHPPALLGNAAQVVGTPGVGLPPLPAGIVIPHAPQPPTNAIAAQLRQTWRIV